MTDRAGRNRPIARRAMFAMTLATLGGPTRAQTDAAYPNRPVRFVIPSAAGGPTDVMARMISPALNATLGQPVIIINRPGAGGNIGVVRGVGFDVRARGPQGLAERMAREVPMWRDVIVQSRIELL